MWADLHISLCQKSEDDYDCKYLPKYNIRRKNNFRQLSS